MTIASDLVRQTRRHLSGVSREGQNTLLSAYTAGGSTLALTHPIAGVTAGALVEVDWTLYTVVASNTTTNTLTVLLEDEFADAINHDAGARVLIRPRFPSLRIIDAINAELHSLSGSGNGLYRPVRALPDVDGVFTVPTGAMMVLAAWDDEAFPLPAARFRVDEATTGQVLRTTGEAPAEVVFGCSFGTLSGVPTEDVEVATGLPDTAHDVPTYGAAVRLGAGVEAGRNVPDTQGDTRRAEEVPMTAYSTAMRLLTQQRAQRVFEEALRQQQRYGVVRWRRV